MPLKVLSSILIMLFLLGLCACSKLPEKRHPIFVKAVRYKDKENYSEAAKLFEQYLLSNPTSFLTHQELASIYFDNLDDPFRAAYHYQECLKYIPEHLDKTHYQAWQKEAEKRYFEKLKVTYKDSAADKLVACQKQLYESQKLNDKLKSYIIQLMNRNKELKRMIRQQAENQGRRSSPQTVDLTEKETTPDETATAAGPEETAGAADAADTGTATSSEAEKKTGKTGNDRYYVVVKGDTLMKISRKVYGKSKYFMTIYEANKETLPSQSKLQLGQKLRIPPLPESEQ